MIGIMMASFFPMLGWMLSRSKRLEYDIQASVLLQEGMEVAYNVFLDNWDKDFAAYPPGIYHPVVNMAAAPDAWDLIPGEQTSLETRFARKVEVVQVCRNLGNGEQLPGSCHAGPNRDTWSKKVITTITWREDGANKAISAELLLTNLSD